MPSLNDFSDSLSWLQASVSSILAIDGTFRMGDYNDLLTVRELIDLVEFLKAIR